MKATISIINIGDELLIGQVVNTNAAKMGTMLTQAGFEIVDTNTVSDTETGILQALEASLNKANVVLISGGLGPTKDDITKTVLSRYFNTPLVFCQEAHDNMERIFKARGVQPNAANHAQAMLPEACLPLPNPNGTAFGMWFDTQDHKVVVSMPGVPYEMLAILEEEVIPRLSEQFQPQAYFQHTIMTQGVGESSIAEQIAFIEDQLPAHIHLAYLPRPGLVRLRLSGQSNDKQSLQAEVLKIAQEIENILGKEVVFGYNDIEVAEVVGECLLSKGFTVSTAESCTGGTIAARISAIAGASQYYKGSVVSYDNAIKTHVLGVEADLINSKGAVSEEVVEAMLVGAQKLMKTDCVIAVSGIAGPSGGTIEKPVGTTYIGVLSPKGMLVKRFQFGDNRERNIERTVVTALNMLRNAIG